MKKRHTLLISIVAIGAIVAFSQFRATKLTERNQPPALKALFTSIVVDETARFHPLLRSGTYKPLEDEKVENLTSYLAVNSETGEVYTASNATDKISPASFVKLMTSMVALDVSTPSAELMATGNAAVQEPTHLGVKPGEIFTLEELIPAMIMTSANDAATIVGEEVLRPFGLGEESFIVLMNKKAELLGLGKTNFTNTQGFDDDNQYSNAYDLARIAKYSFTHYPLVTDSAKIQYATIEENENHGFYHLPNWNALLGTYPGVNGLKIGYTENAGYSTIVTATRDGASVIVIVIGSEGIIERDLAAATLLNHAYEKEGHKGVEIIEDLIEPRIEEWRQLRKKILEELELQKN